MAENFSSGGSQGKHDYSARSPVVGCASRVGAHSEGEADHFFVGIFDVRVGLLHQQPTQESSDGKCLLFRAAGGWGRWSTTT